MTELELEELVEYAFEEKKSLMAEQIRNYQEGKIQANEHEGHEAFNLSVNELLDKVEISLEALNQKQISSETFILNSRLFANCLEIKVMKAVMAYQNGVLEKVFQVTAEMQVYTDDKSQTLLVESSETGIHAFEVSPKYKLWTGIKTGSYLLDTFLTEQFQ